MSDSKKFRGRENDVDYSLLVDGLEAEREQGIAIDVAYRFFSTISRKFIVADTPGHEQYTRNMITGASNADLAIILTDARKGILSQTRRHAYLAQLIGVKKIVLAVNKMDLLGYDEAKFLQILNDFSQFADQIGINDIFAIPVSATKGDNITDSSANMPWFSGPNLMTYLEQVEISKSSHEEEGFCMPVQWVNRPGLDFRGFSGKVVSGRISENDEIHILPSGKTTKVKNIVTLDGDKKKHIAGNQLRSLCQMRLIVPEGK